MNAVNQAKEKLRSLINERSQYDMATRQHIVVVPNGKYFKLFELLQSVNRTTTMEGIIQLRSDLGVTGQEDEESEKSQVMTRTDLIRQGSCCGNKCTNCPYTPRYQKGSMLVC
jgi:hypothetical protein